MPTITTITADRVTDEWGNTATLAKWGSEEEARAALATLIGCQGCWDCTDCRDCTNCTDCQNCTDCTGCTNCRDCTDCVDCVGSVGRRECLGVWDHTGRPVDVATPSLLARLEAKCSENGFAVDRKATDDETILDIVDQMLGLLQRDRDALAAASLALGTPSMATLENLDDLIRLHLAAAAAPRHLTLADLGEIAEVAGALRVIETAAPGILPGAAPLADAVLRRFGLRFAP